MKLLRPEPQPQTFEAQDAGVEVVVLEDALGTASIRLRRKASTADAKARATHPVTMMPKQP